MAAAQDARPKAREVLAKASRKAASLSADVVARLYHPQTVSEEYFDAEQNVWTAANTINYTYNTAGQVLTEKNEYNFVEYTYNSDGTLAKQAVYDTYEGKKTLQYENEYTYDTVVKNLVVKEVVKMYMPGSDTPEVGEYGAEITRNGDGNITKIQSYSVYGTEKNYEDALIIEYGADKKAVKITDQTTNYDGSVEVYCMISDIVWATTDGQIITYEFDDPNSDMYFSNNRIASATITQEDEWPAPGKFTATYNGDSYNSKVMVGNDVALEINFTCLGKNAVGDEFEDIYTYECSCYEAEYEFDEDTNKYFIEYTRAIKEVNRADAFGINTYNSSERTYKYANPEYEDETDVETCTRDVTYDETIGYPLSYVSRYNNEQPNHRVTFSDYVNVDPDGVASAIADSDAAPEYFTLQGVRVAVPAEGLYIVRRGNKVTKEIIR